MAGSSYLVRHHRGPLSDSSPRSRRPEHTPSMVETAPRATRVTPVGQPVPTDTTAAGRWDFDTYANLSPGCPSARPAICHAREHNRLWDERPDSSGALRMCLCLLFSPALPASLACGLAVGCRDRKAACTSARNMCLATHTHSRPSHAARSTCRSVSQA